MPITIHLENSTTYTPMNETDAEYWWMSLTKNQKLYLLSHYEDKLPDVLLVEVPERAWKDNEYWKELPDWPKN